MTELPLRFGRAEDFARVREALRDADYFEAAVVRALGLRDMSEVGPGREKDLSGVDPRLALLIRTLLFFEAAERSELIALLGESTLNAFVALDILRCADEGGSSYYASVFLYPVSDLYIASDRPVALDGRPVSASDWVLPAIFEGSLTFLRLLPSDPVTDALDLGTGSGVAALVLSRSARRTVAVDITARATHYARFNRLLNARGNVEVLQGDLYGPVHDGTFDLIVAHPPYVPAARNRAVYRDAGETGEYLVRRIVQGLPRHLRSGGTYIGLSFSIDTATAPFEQRVRGWLGEAHGDFDVVFAAIEEKPVEIVLQRLAEKEPAPTPAEFLRQWLAFSEMGAMRFAYGALAVRRRTSGNPGEPWTHRMRTTEAAVGTDLQGLLRTRR